MAVDNPFSIAYGELRIGGTSDSYQLHAPYVLDRSFDRIRVVFDVVVTATSYDQLRLRSDELETAFRKRDQTLEIALSPPGPQDESRWVYGFGKDLLNPTARIVKSGNPVTDQGLSRAYTCEVEGEVPADDQDGLRELEVNVNFTASRQQTVTMRGVYTLFEEDTPASQQYRDSFDDEAATILEAIKQTATFELVAENYTQDRNDHTCRFERQYIELLEKQTKAQLDDTQIRDHKITFSDLSQHPGDSKEDVYRLRRVIGNYDCGLDIEATPAPDPRKVFKDKVRPHLIQLFQTNFKPRVFALEDARASYDETSRRMSVAFQFLYQHPDGEAIVEMSQQVAFRETRTLDRTPVHEEDELAAHVDVGWANLERLWTRTVIVVGPETPKLRIIETPRKGAAGLLDEPVAGQVGPDQGATTKVQKEGWNIVQSTSQTGSQWIGQPDGTQIEVTTLTETVIESYNRVPGRRTATPIQRTPATRRRSTPTTGSRRR